MNKKGFTLVELLAVLVILGIVIGIAVPSMGGVMNKSKQKSEDAFVETLKDAMDIYISSGVKNISASSYSNCSDTFYKKAIITFQNVIDSPYQPINSASLKNPANEKNCSVSANIEIFKTGNYVYYYRISKSALNCLDNTKSSEPKNKINYISNLKDPGNFSC